MKDKNKIRHNVGFIPGVLTIIMGLLFLFMFIRNSFDYELLQTIPSLIMSIVFFSFGFLLIHTDI